MKLHHAWVLQPQTIANLEIGHQMLTLRRIIYYMKET